MLFNYNPLTLSFCSLRPEPSGKTAEPPITRASPRRRGPRLWPHHRCRVEQGFGQPVSLQLKPGSPPSWGCTVFSSAGNSLFPSVSLLSSSSGKPRLRGADLGTPRHPSAERSSDRGRRAIARTCRDLRRQPTCLNRSPPAPLGPPVSRSLSSGRAKLGPGGSPEDDERKVRAINAQPDRFIHLTD